VLVGNEMHVGILGAESLGVRSLSCVVEVEDHKIVIDPGSDIQLLDGEAVSLILDWQLDIVLVGGPPLYFSWLSPRRQKIAWENARRLACHVDTLLLDHHLLRCEEGLSWLDRLSSETGHWVICAADFMQRPRHLLEAQREQLYEEMPVPEGWHETYARGDADTRRYQDYKLENQ
jgi:predicted metallo-beta-lactamase superfamily hydrolase